MEHFSSLASVGAHSSGLKDVISLELLFVENKAESWISRSERNGCDGSQHEKFEEISSLYKGQFLSDWRVENLATK